jgi:hypothetical protein
MKELGFPLVATAMLFGGFIPILMMIVTWLYVNKTPRKQRLIELGYGTDNKWYRGKKIDFVDANYVISLMVAGAFVASHLYFLIKRRREQGKKTEAQFDLFPNLHRDENYLKLRQEFPFFYYWVLTMAVFVLFGMTVLGIGMGIDKGWFGL